MDQREASGNGAKLVARAWVDAAFKVGGLGCWLGRDRRFTSGGVMLGVSRGSQLLR